MPGNSPRRRLAAALFLIAALPASVLVGLGLKLVEADRMAEKRRREETLRREAESLKGHVRLAMDGLASAGAELMLVLRGPSPSLAEIEIKARAVVEARREFSWFEVFDTGGRILAPDLDLPFRKPGRSGGPAEAMVPFDPVADESVETLSLRHARMLALRSAYFKAAASSSDAEAAAGLQKVLEEASEPDLRGRTMARLAGIRFREGRIDDAFAVCEKYLDEDPGGLMEDGRPSRGAVLLTIAGIWTARGRPDRGMESLFWLWDDLLRGKLDADRDAFESLGREISEAVTGAIGGSPELSATWLPLRDKFMQRQGGILGRDADRRLFLHEALPAFRKTGAWSAGGGLGIFSMISGDRLHLYLAAPAVADHEWGDPSPGIAFGIDAEFFCLSVIPGIIAGFAPLGVECGVHGHKGPVADEADYGPESVVVETQVLDEIPSLWLRLRQAPAEVRFGDARLVLYGAILAVSIAAVAAAAAFIFRTYSREQDLAKTRSEFVSNVTHELKTPLTSINMFADMLRRGRVQNPDKQKEYSEIIYGEAVKLSRLIDNVLDFSRIEAGRKTYDMADVDAAAVAAAAVESASFAAKSAGFTISLDAPPGPVVVSGDADALGRALLNLVSNAMKFSGKSREVFVRVKDRGAEAALEVEDRGLGIPKDEQGRIFQKFYRIRREGFEKVPGTGLGLSLVKSIADAHGGRIELDSEPGKGSVFRIVLPKCGKQR